jgi:hypothetical protein
MTAKYTQNEIDKIVHMYNGGHSISAIKEQTGIKSIQTIHKYLRNSGLRRHIDHQTNSGSFAEFTPDSCYWAGFIAADGCVNKSLTSVRIQLHMDDRRHIEKAMRFVGDAHINIVDGSKTTHSIDGSKEYISKYSYADINSTAIVHDLIGKFNITPAKSMTLQPPKIDSGDERHYIRGYFDGDGSLYYSKANGSPQFNVVSGSRQMLEWVAKQLKDQFPNFATHSFDVTSRNEKHYTIRFGCWNRVVQVMDWLYEGSTAETRLERKHDRYMQYKEHLEEYKASNRKGPTTTERPND